MQFSRGHLGKSIGSNFPLRASAPESVASHRGSQRESSKHSVERVKSPGRSDDPPPPRCLRKELVSELVILRHCAKLGVARPCSSHPRLKIPDLCDVFAQGRTTSKARVNFASRARKGVLRPSMLPQHSAWELFFQEGPGRCISCLVLPPHSILRLFYEVLGLFLICFDLVWLPIEAFNPQTTGFVDAMSWVTSCYWLLDIPASFLVGYPILEEGTVEMRVPKIARNYFKTWFLFDIILVGLDWGLHIWNFLLTSAESGASAGVAFFRMAKTVRLLRFLRLLRLLKARGRMTDLLEQVQSEASLIVFGILKLVAFIVLVNHLVACVWYAIGALEPAREDRWVYEFKLESKNLWYKYSTALHWSLTQFTPASMEVMPQNEYERFFTVCMILSGMLIFSSFVSAITNAMNQLRNLNSWRHEQESLLRRYLGENSVTPSLTARIHNCLNKAMQHSRRRVHENEITILQLLPLSLKFELSNEIYAPAIGKHPFFTFCHSVLPSESRKIYSNAVSQKSLLISQELITTGEAGKHMYFLVSGTLVYSRDDDEKYLQKIFDRLDESGSGELTLENLLEGARRDPEFQSRLRVMDIDEVDLQQLFEMIDADGSGAIEAHEFIAPLSRWVRDSKTAPRFIKHNMLQSLDMQEELLKLQQYHFSQLSQRIDSLAAGTLAPAEAHFSDGMGTEGDVDDGNPILQTLPETEEDTIQQDVNEPGCELGIEQPAVSPYLSFAAERQPKPDPPAASPISTPHEREKNETPSDVTGDLFTVGDMDVHEPTGPGSGTARPRQVASKDPSRAPRKSIRSSEGSSALALFERLRNGMTGDEVQSALSRALEAFEVSFEIGMRKASERLLLQCMAKAEAALQEHLGPGRNYSSTSWSRLSSMEHVRAGRSQSRQSTQRVDGPPPPARRRSIRKSLGPSTATGSFWDLDS
ncbi:unnamed protein product [Effrenium voratum]|nr:unnamed protein product [Effrenium voratum]